MSRTLGRVLAFIAAIVLTPAALAAASNGGPAPAKTSPTKTTTTTTSRTTTTTSTTTTPTPPPPKPKHGAAKLFMLDAFYVHSQPVTVPGRTLHVDGVVHPYLPGQWVTVKSFLGRKLIKTDH